MLAVLITTESLYNPCSRLTGSISPSTSPSPQYCLSRRIEIQSSVSVKLSVPSIPYIALQPKYDALSMSWSVHLHIKWFLNLWFLSLSSNFNCIISYVKILWNNLMTDMRWRVISVILLYSPVLVGSAADDGPLLLEHLAIIDLGLVE